ncbi:cell wall metabolism sensor histidine kinase WalK [Nonomuraea sp. C10]|uniref:sensor histidine kinase n=1 Tax=Nonomuraea sp. C10 TaxID=2600577 RepID=UPI0011CE4862|nr:HAMP domain-containing sensor histidine kinase [Nonomuraea sp. C10]TXK39757.1 HAMP domain-containing histidine kinase [Nonomuraea sp. C10]
MRRRSLRSRLTLLVAAAVAIAVAVSAVGCWYFVRRELSWQLNQSLRDIAVPVKAMQGAVRNCSSEPAAALDGHPAFTEPMQIVFPGGERCVMGNTAIKVTPHERRIAAGYYGQWEFYDGRADDGTPLRVYVRNVDENAAFVVGRPVEEINDTLRRVTVLLAGVAALGVLVAASVGLLVSRAALRPVGRLTRAVEHIAQTEDLDTRIPVEGGDEIARLSASFNAMTAALAGSRDRQRQLVADAGHELRTPLTTLRTNIDLLLRSEQTGRSLDPGAKERLLVNVKAQFAELTTLVGDLLQLARGDTDHEPHAELAFQQVVTAAVERARLRGAEIAADLEPWYVVGGAASLERAVLNLLDNAAKFSPDSEVEVTLRDGELTVRDHGPGIPEEELPHVFDRFWRSPSARSLPGSGLGLAIVHQAVKEVGGEIRLRNAADGGVVATMTLPGTPAPGARA